MSSLGDFLRSHLNFTTRERRGLIGILGISALIYFLPNLIEKDEDYSNEIKAFKREIDRLDSNDSMLLLKDGLIKSNSSTIKWDPFYFNPNTVEAQKLEKFGWPQFMIDRFAKYRSAGAKFYVKDDLQKLYGLSPKDFSTIKPYIIFESKVQKNQDSAPWPKNISKNSIKIELNSADSNTLISIQGIGPFLSSKIIAYRNALGGFVSIDQLDEIYGVKLNQMEPIKSKVYVDKSAIKRLNVNTSDYSQLSKHPYISSKEAKAIINYRLQHGRYSSFKDLENLILLQKQTLSKIEMYLEF